VPIPRAGRCLCHYTEPPPSKPPRKKRYRRPTPWSREQYRDATGRFAIRPERPRWEAEYQAEYLKSWSPVWDIAEGKTPMLYPLDGGPPMTIAEARAASIDTPPDPIPDFLKSAAPDLFKAPRPAPPPREDFPRSGRHDSLEELKRQGRESRHGPGRCGCGDPDCGQRKREFRLPPGLHLRPSPPCPEQSG
jgi:hypothetical protein